MLSLKTFMELVNYRITEGSDYCWSCYGTNAFTLDSWDGSHTGYSASITFNTKTQIVYEVSVYDYKNERSYRIINPDFVEVQKTECKARGVSDEAWDGVPYIDLDVDQDFIDKITAIVAGVDYDTRVSIPFTCPDSEMLTYMKLAHEMDITFNELVERALKQALARLDIEQ